MVDFNYEYVLLRKELRMPIMFALILGDGLLLDCAFDRTIDGEKSLYRIENYKEIHDDPEQHVMLSRWVQRIVTEAGAHESRQVYVPLSNKRRRMEADDEISELEYL